MRYILIILPIFLVSVTGCILHKSNLIKIHIQEKSDEPEAARSWELARVINPITGEVPIQNLVDAYQKNIENSQRNQAPVNGIEWVERGPNNVGGRTRAIIFDKNDTTYKRVMAASVGGGLFTCEDITASTPVWNKVNDFFSNLAINCLIQHPRYPDTLYFGTGEGFGNADAIRGSGIWRSADGGTTWVQLASSMSGSVPYYINRLAVDSNGKIWAATSNGLFSSSNGGNTWSALLRTSGTTPTCASNNGKDVELAKNGDIYYTCATQVWRYRKVSQSWINITPTGSFNRIEIACAPSNTAYIYALCQAGSSSAVTGFFSSIDSGNTWRSRTVPLVYDQNTTPSVELSRGQAWYDLSLTVDPDTAKIVYAGGIEYIKSTDTGATYKQITAWSLYAMPSGANLTSSQSVHSDHHILVFRPGNKNFALLGNDGGIYKGQNMNNTFPGMPTFTTVNTGYNVTQYYACAIANTAGSNIMLGGAQDNGTQKYTQAGLNNTTAASGGDGCYCHIDQDNSNNQITSYVYNNIYISTNGTNYNKSSSSDNTGDFVNPSDLDGTNNIFYSKAGSGIIYRWSNIFGTVTKTSITLTGVSSVSHIKVSPNNPTTVYIGTSGGRIYKINRMDTITSAVNPVALNSSSFGGRISSIEIRKCQAATDDTILVTQSNYGLSNSVFITVNGTSGTPTWTDIDDNNTLPDIPVNWGLLAPVSMAKEVLLATELGIYSCDNIFASTPVWGQSNTGFANVRVDMLKFRQSDSMIAAATHGRGLYTTLKYKAPSAQFGVSARLGYIGSTFNFYDSSINATSWAWDFDNNGSIDATEKNPVWKFGTSGYKTVTLIINGGISSRTQTQYIYILPSYGLPYTLTQGGNFESNQGDFFSVTSSGTPWEIGNSTISGKNGTVSGNYAWVTGLTASAYANYSTSYLYTPCFNLSGASGDSIKFYIKNAFETNYDGMRVEYSTDLGNTWNPLSVSVISNWYDFSNSSSGTSFPQYQAFFNTTNSNYSLKKYTLSGLNGNSKVAFRFVFKSDYTGTNKGIAMDNFELVSSNITLPLLETENTITTKSEYLGAFDTVYFYSPNGKMMAKIINLSSHNYGLTALSIDQAGNGVRNYSTNTSSSSKIGAKTFTVTPENNNTQGQYKVSLYFSSSEVQGWKDSTQHFFSEANLIKCPQNISNGTLQNGEYGKYLSFNAYGNGDSVISATFETGFSGFGFGKNNGVLPIADIAFSGINTGIYNQLLWKVNREKRNTIYSLERSLNGKDFIPINTRTAFEDALFEKLYNFTDTLNGTENSIIFYRLMALSSDHQMAYNSVIKIYLNKSLRSPVVYPVPANNSLNFIGIGENIYTYKIINSDGKESLTGIITGNSTFIDISAIANGFYLFIATTEDGKNYTIPFTKGNGE